MRDFRTPITFFLSLLFCNLLAQDSFDREAVDLWVQNSIELKSKNPDSAELYAQKVVRFAPKIDYKKAESQGYNLLGIIAKNRGNYNDAISHMEKGLTIRQQINDSTGIALTQDLIGQVWQRQGKMEKALEHYLSALHIREQLGDPLEIARSLRKLGVFYSIKLQHKEALTHLRKAHSIFSRHEEKNMVAELQNDLAIVHYYQDSIDSALFYWEKSLNTYTELEDLSKIQLTRSNLTAVLFSQKKYDEAREYYSIVLKEALELDDPLRIGEARMNIGLCYFHQQKHSQARNHYLAALRDFEKTQSFHAFQEIHFNLSEVYHALNESSLALEHYKQHVQFKDSVLNQQAQTELLDLQTKYETAEKEKTIQQLAYQQTLNQSKKRQLIWGIAGLSCVLLLLGTWVYMYYRKVKMSRYLLAQKEILFKQKVDVLLQEQELKSVHSLLEGQDKERKRIAQDLHDRLGSMLATIKLHFDGLETKLDDVVLEKNEQWQRIDKMLDDACDEVRLVSHNLASGVLQKFGLRAALEDLCSSLNTSEEITVSLHIHGLKERLENKVEIILYRVIQELVSNVLRHANANELTIQLTVDSESLNLYFEDDGDGFDSQQAREGMGLKNIKARIHQINGTLHLDTFPERGTIYSIDIPLNSYARPD